MALAQETRRLLHGERSGTHRPSMAGALCTILVPRLLIKSAGLVGDGVTEDQALSTLPPRPYH